MNNLNREKTSAQGFRFVFLIIACTLVYFVWQESPNVKFPLLLNKLSLVTVAAILGYFIDVMLFPNFRPADLAKEINLSSGQEQAAWCSLAGMCNIRRAIVIVGLVIGVSLGI